MTNKADRQVRGNDEKFDGCPDGVRLDEMILLYALAFLFAFSWLGGLDT